jgi:hypothetical protein
MYRGDGRGHAGYLVSRVREERGIMTCEYLETLPVFDETEEMERVQEMS